MKKIKTDILIPFELHVRERCDNCSEAIHDRFTRAKALVKKGGQEFISLNSYSSIWFDLLEEIRDIVDKEQTVEKFSFYAAQAKHMLEEWITLISDILEMGADSSTGLSKDDLQKGLEDVMTEIKDILDDFTSASEELFQMGAPFPTREFLRNILEGSQTATDE